MQFACVLCRQLQNTAGLLHELVALREAEAGQEQTSDVLLEHLAAVNGLGDAAFEPHLCRAWGQEVLCRAYALHVAARYAQQAAHCAGPHLKFDSIKESCLVKICCKAMLH